MVVLEDKLVEAYIKTNTIFSITEKQVNMYNCLLKHFFKIILF